MKKRIILLSGLLALAIGGQILLRPLLGDRQEAVSLSATMEEQKTGDLTNTSELFEVEEKDPETQNLRGHLAKQLITMVIFVGIIGVGAWFFCKKMACNWTGGKGENITVTETVNLGPRKLVHIVQVGSKQFLLGSTSENIRLLAEVTDCLEQSDE